MRRYACLPRSHVEQEGFTLTSVQDEHIERIRQWRNAQMHALRQSKPIEPEEQNAYYARAIWPSMASAQPDNILLSYLHGPELLGYGGLVHISWEHRRAEVSFLLNPELTHDDDRYAAWFVRFLSLLNEVAFLDLRLHKLHTEAYSHRVHHVRCIERAGFEFEGRLREHILLDGKYIDSVLHARINPHE